LATFTVAGLACLALTMAAAAQDASPAPAAVEAAPGDRLDDYGIRCLEVGWCAMPPGQPQPPSFITVSADVAETEAAAPSDADDYGIRCLEVGWCAMPPGQPQPSVPPAAD
jgi:hypothetical protein